MNMFNKLPLTITINEREYFINTDFRYFIEFEEKMQDIERLSKQEQKEIIFNVLKSFCPAFFKNDNDIKSITEKFLWFYKCGREDYHISTVKGKKKSQVFSYKYDDELIWGAFFDRGFDLTKDKIHWWKFNALLLTMPDECEFNKVKGYRIYTGEDKNILELKKYWTLPLNEKEKERIEKITKELMKYN